MNKSYPPLSQDREFCKFCAFPFKFWKVLHNVYKCLHVSLQVPDSFDASSPSSIRFAMNLQWWPPPAPREPSRDQAWDHHFGPASEARGFPAILSPTPPDTFFGIGKRPWPLGDRLGTRCGITVSAGRPNHVHIPMDFVARPSRHKSFFH